MPPLASTRGDYASVPQAEPAVELQDLNRPHHERPLARYRPLAFCHRLGSRLTRRKERPSPARTLRCERRLHRARCV